MNGQTAINSTIQEQIYQIIRHEVINHVFIEGEQMKESELAQRFKISRSPIREALHRLVGDGILTIIPNRGIFVKEFTPKYIIDVLDLRFVLERRGLSRIGEMLTPCKRAELLHIRGEMEKLINANDTDLEKHATLDTVFHNFIINFNDNTFVSEVAEKISVLNSMFRYLSLQSPKRAIESQVEHMQMIDSMLVGDINGAIDIYERHICGTKNRVVSEFEYRRQDPVDVPPFV